MAWRRSAVLQAVPLLAAMAPTARAATTDLVVNCDTARGPVITAAAHSFRDASGINVDVFPTAPELILPQLARDVQNDIVVTSAARMEQAARDALVGAGPRAGAWRNGLVLAARRDAAGGNGPVAVPDATPGSDIDGPAIPARLRLQPVSVR